MSASVSSGLVATLFDRVVPDWGSSDGLTEVGSEELDVGSSRIWLDVWGLLNAA